MRKVTLCFLIEKDSICLAMKKRGFGMGKWNGVGGKVEEGESLKDAAVRELHEEIGVQASGTDLKEVGNLKFYFKGEPDWDQHMHIFFIRKWTGVPVETDEMSPKWYELNDIPYKNMWIDDPYWLPKVLEGKSIEGEFHFTKTGDEIISSELHEL